MSDAEKKRVDQDLAFWKSVGPLGWRVYGWTYDQSCCYLEENRRGSQTVSGDFMRAMADKHDAENAALRASLAAAKEEAGRFKEALERIAFTNLGMVDRHQASQMIVDWVITARAALEPKT